MSPNTILALMQRMDDRDSKLQAIVRQIKPVNIIGPTANALQEIAKGYKAIADHYREALATVAQEAQTA